MINNMKGIKFLAFALLIIFLAVSCSKAKKVEGPLASSQSQPQTPATTPANAPEQSKGGPMVSVPAGEFWMGCNNKVDKQCKADEKPYHKVYLDAFYIDKFLVTQSEYNKCVTYGACAENQKWDAFTGDRQPVVGVNWDEANTYCKWAGKRLPTEAEWEKAARGADGRIYPWGNEFDGKKLNFCDKNCSEDVADKTVDDGYSNTSPVGSYPAGASPYGAMDMAGNVLEWVSDWYDENYYSKSPSKDPKGPDSGTSRVLRGGAWSLDARDARASIRYRSAPTLRGNILGFRCLRD
jgi:formylglycine-generating enzyme required for sulfatase activity